jgi:hypothetical protein
MNPMQKQFSDFFIERTREDKKEEARAVLEADFAHQDAGIFDKTYLEELMPKYFELIKPEFESDLKAAMASFSLRL